MAQGEDIYTIYTSFEDLTLYFSIVMGRQASEVHTPPECLILRIVKVMGTTSFRETADKISVPHCN